MCDGVEPGGLCTGKELTPIHISEPTRLLSISYAVFCLKKKKIIMLQKAMNRNFEK